MFSTLYLIFAIGFSLVIGYVFFSKFDYEVGTDVVGDSYTGKVQYTNLVGAAIFPIFIIICILFALFFHGINYTVNYAIALCVKVSILFNIYYCLLLLIIPFTRKRINARANGALWLIPCFVCLGGVYFRIYSSALFILPLSYKVAYIIGLIWLIGFLIYMGYHILSHIQFKESIVNSMVLVTDPDIIKLWEDTLLELSIKKKQILLASSSAIYTPVSLDYTWKKALVVIPDHTYTQEELYLIFKHELIHISRGDADTKFFLVFIQAFCWFNPFIKKIFRKCSEDIELSCDETVLLKAGEDRKKLYASVILNTVGDERGFTSCLSANAYSLKYRMEKIMGTPPTHSGVFMAVLCCLVMILSLNLFTISLGSYHVSDFVEDGLTGTIYYDQSVYTIKNEEELSDYIRQLEISRFYDETKPDGDEYYGFYTGDDSYSYLICIYDHYLSIEDMDTFDTVYYYLTEPINHDFIMDQLEYQYSLNF